jgi:hypothetical protein
MLIQKIVEIFRVLPNIFIDPYHDVAWNTLGNRNFKKFNFSYWIKKLKFRYWLVYYFKDFELRVGEQQDLCFELEVGKSLDLLAGKSPNFEKVWALFFSQEVRSALAIFGR